MSIPRETLDLDTLQPRATSKDATKGVAKDGKGGRTSNEGKDARGKFAKGNKGGPGNPFAAHVAQHRLACFSAVGPERFQRALRMTYQQLFGLDSVAEARDRLAWCKWYADRAMGRVPIQVQLEELPAATREDDPDAFRYE